MKIISIKSLNINSLKGTTEINFEELTKDSALFSIAGPTGSGKSTILDIISCALYGQTARLKNPNDLMSRNCGEAYCEVEFEIRGKSYRSSWSQKRARKKHDGKFQTAKMELVDLDEDKIIPLKSREVPKKIEELSGLDFGRFTQSMLLAQGSFDAFLKADEKERSILLEKITGTQIYADISIAIFEKHRAYQQEMESDQKVLESIELLDEEVVEQKQKELGESIVIKKETDEQLKQLTLALNWLERLLELKSDSKKYTKEYIDVTKLKEESKSSFEKLEQANKALNVFTTFTSYKQFKENLVTDKELLKNLDKELTDLSQNMEQKDKEYGFIKTEFVKQNRDFEVESKKLKEAREVATKEQEHQKNLSKEQENLKSGLESLTQTQDALAVIIKKYEDVKKQLEFESAYIQTNTNDKKLIETLGILEKNIEEYKQERVELSKAQIKLEDSEKMLLKEEMNYNEKKEEVDKLSSSYKEVDAAYSSLVQETQNEFEFEEKTKNDLVDIERLIRSFENYVNHINKRESESKEQERYTDLINSLLETKRVSEQHISELKKHIETLRQKQEQEQLLKKYEDDRDKLVDGKACMLCGSTKHPYNTHLQEIHVDKTKEMIVTQVQGLEEQENSLQEQVSRINILETKLETSQLEVKKLEEEVVTLQDLFRQHSFKVSSDSEFELKEKEAELTKKLDSIKQNRIKKDELLKERDKAAKKLQVKERELNEIKSLLEKVNGEKKQLSATIEACNSKINKYIKAIDSFVKEFGIKFELETVDIHFEELVKRNKLYLQATEKIKELEIELNKFSIDKKADETELVLLTKEIERSKTKIEDIEHNIKNLSKKRVEILNVADLNVYENEITTKYKTVQDKEQMAKSVLDSLRIKHEEREANKKILDTKIVECSKKLDALSIELEELYRQNGFKDDVVFQNAMLEKTKREELEAFCSSIDDRFKQTQTLKEESLKNLQEHEKEPPTAKAKEELEVLQSLLKQKADALQENIGSEKKELEVNQENSDKFKEQIESLKKKQDSFKVWVKLNELVGSTDGTKFKKFAQGITLDQLINLANQHLKILTARYTLVRNQNKLLELEIIDAYQGNAVRPVSTLSGGESFIASLALALGLSELASQKIKIDSLFLDEGFGTLDEESLETALNALNLLQNGGKMVGVISHVEALKERIPLQIKVIQNGDGTSYIEI
ncbi:MAG: AAA family ATPase [Campylobacterota bacterium]|nr:AAA family ATPase [Campylobacterota bacterium]